MKLVKQPYFHLFLRYNIIFVRMRPYSHLWLDCLFLVLVVYSNYWHRCLILPHHFNQFYFLDLQTVIGWKTCMSRFVNEFFYLCNTCGVTLKWKQELYIWLRINIRDNALQNGLLLRKTNINSFNVMPVLCNWILSTDLLILLFQ